jgi:hypothetical protein
MKFSLYDFNYKPSNANQRLLRIFHHPHIFSNPDNFLQDL